jgi:hypothetical protein
VEVVQPFEKFMAAPDTRPSMLDRPREKQRLSWDQVAGLLVP